SLSAGKRVATAVPSERDRRLRPALVRRGRGGSVQGFPSRYYGRGVLDEHTALRWQAGAAERTETEIAGRGARIVSLLTNFGRHGPRAPLPELPLNGQTGNGAWQGQGVF